MDSILATVFIGLALAMDCLAVSFATGAHQREKQVQAMLILAFMFGFFQFGMTCLGWLLGSGFASVIEEYAPIVAASLLFIIGGKMIFEGIRDGEEEETPDVFRLSTVVVLAIATSIDALAVGISFAVLQVSPLFPAIVIGIITAGVSMVGVVAGGKAAGLLGHRMDIVGGIILVVIGIRILVEHTM